MIYKGNESKGDWLAIIMLGICIVFMIIGIIETSNKNEKSTSSPIEDMIIVDSIKRDNDRLILEVNNLDSIKDAKIIEVKDLDNDSTLKLFYQLISR